MKPIGILGVGQAGGNIAEIAATYGFTTAIINTNANDTISNSKVPNKYYVPGRNGAGQNRTVGIEAVQFHWDEICKFVGQSFKNVKVLLVAFSTDGGTGSGMGPILIDVLTSYLPDTIIGAIAILPEKNVLAGNKMNASKAMAELSAIEGIGPVFIVDNEQVRKTNPQATKSQLYQIVNTQVIRSFDAILRITTKSSPLGNFDEADLLNVLNTRGAAIISTTVVNDCKTQAEVSNQFNLSLIRSVFAPIETVGVVKAGLIYEGPEGLSKLISVPALFERIGEPLLLFEGNYPNESDAVITSILTGLPFPEKRLNLMKESLEQNRERLQSLVQKARTQKYEAKVDWVSSLTHSTLKKDHIPNDVSVVAKLAKYKQ
ncbi:cell division protein FtsZ [Collibacillus ludicampi]|jgi:cell division GTPase FtsZ|uniref:Cell division protein FtsZ n=1 Tax=Collibacillus ludicampi TaxID=2771369 RepID=A0AAV4LK06_9BACL|nr:tubulin-like doman-containing protein [Collibacillus ludicampi]GIM47953.1 cell division protein FtsZ [Collibacillus ludicampi]